METEYKCIVLLLNRKQVILTAYDFPDKQLWEDRNLAQIAGGLVISLA